MFDLKNIPFLLYNTVIHFASLGFYMTMIIRSMRGWNSSEFAKVLTNLMLDRDLTVMVRSWTLFVHPFVFLGMFSFCIVERSLKIKYKNNKINIIKWKFSNY